MSKNKITVGNAFDGDLFEIEGIYESRNDKNSCFKYFS